MLNTKSSLTGIDINIAMLQNYLYPILNGLWKTTDSGSTAYNSWGRIYRIPDRGKDAKGFLPSPYAGGNEYSPADLFFDDTIAVHSFFFVSDSEKINDGTAKAQVALIFCVNNIPVLKADIQSEADEEIRTDVEKQVQVKYFDFNLTGTQTGIENVFKEFAGDKRDSLKAQGKDMYPEHRHCFRLNFEVLYDPSETLCIK